MVIPLQQIPVGIGTGAFNGIKKATGIEFGNANAAQCVIAGRLSLDFVAILETAGEFHDVTQTHVVKRGDIDGF